MFSYTPCVPATSHGDPPLEGALRPQLGQSRHPEEKKSPCFRQVKQQGQVRKLSDYPESLLGWPGVDEVSQCTYFWRQRSSDTNDHLLLIMVHSHIERSFINLEKIHYCSTQVKTLLFTYSPARGKACRAA